MAIAIDKADLGFTDQPAGGATIILTTTQAVAVGGFIVVMPTTFASTTADLSSVSGGGLTWAVDVGTHNAANNVYIASAQAPAGLAASTAITATFDDATATFTTMGGLSFTGVKTTSPLDGTPLHTSITPTTAAWSLGGNYAIAAGSVIVGGCWTDGTANPTANTPTAPSLEASEHFNGSDHYGLAIEYRIESSAGSYAMQGTWNTATTWTSSAAACLAAPSGTDTGLAWIRA